MRVIGIQARERWRSVAIVAAVARWPDGTVGLLRLPSGLLLRGRGLREGLPDGHAPDRGLYLQGRRPPECGWPARWVRWPDWWLPHDAADLRDALHEAWRRAGDERVEVACTGGRGRTGTALACLAIIDGVPAADAVAHVRRHYRPDAVETPWQRRFVRRFRA